MKRLGISLFLLALCAQLLAQQTRKFVSAAEAKQLVLAALPEKTKSLPKFELETSESPQFYSYQTLWAGTANGSVVIGHHAVDKTTGDVWNAVMACEEMNTPALRKLQASVRSRIGLSPSQYRKAKRRCPLEVEDSSDSH